MHTSLLNDLVLHVVCTAFAMQNSRVGTIVSLYTRAWMLCGPLLTRLQAPSVCLAP